MKIQESIWNHYIEVAKCALSAREPQLAETMFSAALEEAQRGTVQEKLLAESWFGLGQTHQMQKRFVLAAYYYKKALALYDRDKEKFACQLAAIFDNLAELRLSANDLIKARTFFRKSVAIYERILGKDSEVLAPRLFRLGYIASELSQTDLALAYYRRAKSISTRAAHDSSCP